MGQSVPEAILRSSVMGLFVFTLVAVLFAHSAFKGGRLHCVLWLWPESACWFVRSKY